MLSFPDPTLPFRRASLNIAELNMAIRDSMTDRFGDLPAEYEPTELVAALWPEADRRWLDWCARLIALIWFVDDIGDDDRWQIPDGQSWAPTRAVETGVVPIMNRSSTVVHTHEIHHALAALRLAPSDCERAGIVAHAMSSWAARAHRPYQAKRGQLVESIAHRAVAHWGHVLPAMTVFLFGEPKPTIGLADGAALLALAHDIENHGLDQARQAQSTAVLHWAERPLDQMAVIHNRGVDAWVAQCSQPEYQECRTAAILADLPRRYHGWTKTATRYGRR